VGGTRRVLGGGNVVLGGSNEGQRDKVRTRRKWSNSKENTNLYARGSKESRPFRS